ncbi:MAG: ABC-2 family transporter protein [Sphingobium sp.]
MPSGVDARATRILFPLALATLRSARTSWSANFAAPVVLLGRCCFYILLMTIISALWSRVASEQVAGGLAHLLPPGGLGLYVGVTEIATLCTPAMHLALEDDIRSGQIEARLLRPKPHVVLRFGEAIGSAAARIVVLVGCGAVLLAFSRFDAPPLLWWPALLLLLLLGAVIGVLLSLMIGLSVFWVGRAVPVYIVNQKIAFLLGGLMAPITLYPDWLARIAQATPYAAQIYWVGTMATRPSAEVFAQALYRQLLWIALLSALVAWIWSRGVARLMREGA